MGVSLINTRKTSCVVDKSSATPCIYMFHRVLFHEKQQINPYYFKRGMVHSIEHVFSEIDQLLRKGLRFGSLEDAFVDRTCFHLSFDDGFKEHLELASILKERYHITNSGVSFAINTGHAFSNYYTGMDLIYAILKNKKLFLLEQFLSMDLSNASIDEIKQCVAILSPEQLISLSNMCEELHPYLKRVFMTPEEVIQLSRLFTISSHGMTHRFLTHHKGFAQKEMEDSKQLLEDLCNKSVSVFCYPEWKNDEEIRTSCKGAGYNFGLSIKHVESSKFAVGRLIV